MGQGPETGRGLMRLAAPDVTVSHDLDSDSVRIDVVTNLAARAGGYIKRESTVHCSLATQVISVKMIYLGSFPRGISHCHLIKLLQQKRLNVC